jgi:peptidyl-prolyl cis-trans isomerase B (cyclophilin B)
MGIKTALRLLAAAVLLPAGLLASCSEQETTTTTPELTGQAPSGWVQLPKEVGENEKMQWNSPPEMMIDKSKEYRAIMETEKGTMVLELFAKDVPTTVNNFVFLATNGYYDDTTFHRVLKDFVVQGGDPTGTGRGGPGYTIPDEVTGHKHEVGAISMANAGPGTNTNGSQFFICLKAQPGLDGGYSVFGKLVEGMDVLNQIRLRDPNQNPAYEGDKLLSVRIEVKEGS